MRNGNFFGFSPARPPSNFINSFNTAPTTSSKPCFALRYRSLFFSNQSLSLWRAYIDIEYAILVLKLSYNHIETKQQARFKKTNTKNVTKKKLLMKPKDCNHEIKQLKSVLRHLDFQDKKLLLDELRSNRDLLKNWLQKGEFQ